MTNSQMYHKIVNLKIESSNGDKVDYLNNSEKAELYASRLKTVMALTLSIISVVATIVSFYSITFLFIISGDDFFVPTALGVPLTFGFFSAPFCFLWFLLANHHYKNLVLFYYTNIEQSFNRNQKDLPTFLVTIAEQVSHNEPNIMKNVGHCMNDPKTYYMIHKDIIHRHSINLLDDNAYAIVGIISLLESNHYLFITSTSCTKDDFIKNVISINADINFNSIELIEDSYAKPQNNLANWISHVNKILKEKNKAMILLNFNKVYYDSVIIFITDLISALDFTKMSDIFYFYSDEVKDRKDDNNE